MCLPPSFERDCVFSAIFMLPIATFIHLGAKQACQGAPKGGGTDEKKHLKCLMEKNPSPYGVIERTNRLQDCPNGAQ